ncbi:MAG: MgtC/SapB family protein [Deltaproteobacteria bacterium]|nr:MgtC/SapB family protein [Deltaproteobacteria bacterium]
MEPYESHIALATALAVGLLVGLEREQAKPERGARQLGGIRTYPIFALVGALATLLEPASSWLPLVALLGVFALVTVSYAADIRRDADHGMTTEISVIGVYLLGALATSRDVVEPMGERLILVAAIGVVLTFLLSSKQWFHRTAARITREDFYASLKFLIVAVIVLPLLPDRDFGPLGALNARTLGLLVVTISALSFLGYVAMKLYGAKRGLLLGAALGGLVSSTAVTLSFAGRTKAEPELAPVAAGAITVAWTIMLGRVAVLVALIDPALLATLAIPLGAMILAALLGLLLTFRRDGAGTGELELQNPFELGSAIKVTLVFAAVLLAMKAAQVYIGAEGIYLASALGGTTDVDAVTLSSARLARGGLDPTIATTSILIAIAVNTIVKTGLALGVGGAALGKRMAIVGGLVIAAGGAALALTTLAV